MAILSFFLIAGLFVSVTNTQEAAPLQARLVVRSGTVEVQRAGTWSALNPNNTIQVGERVRTAPASSAAIELGSGRVVTLSERTEVQIRETNGSLAVHLESGNMRVLSSEAIQVAAKDTVLESAERPLEIEVGYDADRVHLTVITGAVRSGPIIINAPETPAKRSYTADSRRHKEAQQPPVFPNYYIYPYVFYGNPGVGSTVPQGRITAPTVLNPTHPAYRPDQIVPPMTDPLRPLVLPFR